MEEQEKTKEEILQDSINYLVERLWEARNFLSQNDHVRNRCYDRGEQMDAELLADIEAARLSIRTYEPLIEELRKEIITDSKIKEV